MTDPSEAKVVNDIATHGWHMISVPADEHGPGFTYTIGLYRSYAHPELIIFGLPITEMQRILDVAGGTTGPRGLSPFRPFRCVWPDKDNHFPWQRECADSIRQLQPSLYETYH